MEDFAKGLGVHAKVKTTHLCGGPGRYCTVMNSNTRMPWYTVQHINWEEYVLVSIFISNFYYYFSCI